MKVTFQREGIFSEGSKHEERLREHLYGSLKVREVQKMLLRAFRPSGLFPVSRNDTAIHVCVREGAVVRICHGHMFPEILLHSQRHIHEDICIRLYLPDIFQDLLF